MTTTRDNVDGRVAEAMAELNRVKRLRRVLIWIIVISGILFLPLLVAINLPTTVQREIPEWIGPLCFGAFVAGIIGVGAGLTLLKRTWAPYAEAVKEVARLRGDPGRPQ